jgi:hypothetical protein
MDDAEANYVIDAVDFVARRGRLFLALYHFDVFTGQWSHPDAPGTEHRFSLAEALRNEGERPGGDEVRSALYGPSLEAAEELADQLEKLSVEGEAAPVVFEGELGELQYFTCPAPVNSPTRGTGDFPTRPDELRR